MITEVHQQGRFYRLSTGRAAHYENLKPHVPSPEDWCIPKDMEGLEYLVVEPACEVNEKGTREKNDGNENLSLDDNEKIGVESDAGSICRRRLERPGARRGAEMDGTGSNNTTGNQDWQS